jgi:hypothetical protein
MPPARTQSQRQASLRHVRRCALVAVAIAALITPPASATGGRSGSVRVQGTIAATWRGDPAGGCGRAGTCGLSGSVTFNPSRTGDLHTGEEGSGLGGPLESAPPVVRAVREVPGSRPSLCMDVLQDAFYGSTLVDVFRTKVRVCLCADARGRRLAGLLAEAVWP